MKIIELPSQEYLKECFNYNEETGELFWKERPLHHFKNVHYSKIWNRKFKYTKAGNICNGYFQICINSKTYYSHRIIWKLITNNNPINEIDHIDTDRLNNRIKNLRESTSGENSLNKKLRKDNISGVKGVSWDKSRNKWSVEIRVNRIKTFLGRFNDIEEAKLVIEKARLDLHGEFANNG